MEANEKRRMEVKQNSYAITKAREKPFSFYKEVRPTTSEERRPDECTFGGFKANPIPAAVSVLRFTKEA